MTKTTKSTAKKATTKPAKKMGRPSKFSKALVNRILDGLRDGKSLRDSCKLENISHSTFLHWLRSDNDEFDNKKLINQYVRAKEVGADVIFDDMIAIADDSSNDTIVTEKGFKIENKEWVSRSKLRIDTRKWVLSKLNPKKYGDKVDSEESDYKDGKVEII